MSEIQAVMFDADGVVQSTPAGFRSELALLCGDAGRAEEFLEDLFAAERPCLTGEGDFVESLAEVLKRWRSSVPVADALQIWEMIEPQEEVLAIADTLRRRGIRIGLATNQQAARAQIMIDKLNYADRFDELFLSCRIGHAKPSRAYFEHVLEALGIEGNRVLFIDDHQNNVDAARACSLRAEVYSLASGGPGMISLLRDHGLHVDDSAADS